MIGEVKWQLPKLFESPFNETNSLSFRVAAVAFHVLTLGVPAAIYYVVRVCFPKVEEMVSKWRDNALKGLVLHPYPGDLQNKSEIEARITKDVIDLKLGNTCLSIRNQNIFKSGAEVIVNAANSHLGGGGGIDGQIHKQGGDAYKAAHGKLRIRYNGNYPSGYASLISSGDLENKYEIRHVIVVNGPQGKTTPAKESALYSCYYNSLLLAHGHHAAHIAFPSISTGIFGFPKTRASQISLRAVSDFINKYPDSPVKTISIHFLNQEGLQDYAKAIQSK